MNHEPFHKNQDRLVSWNILPGMGTRVSTSKVLDDKFMVFSQSSFRNVAICVHKLVPPVKHFFRFPNSFTVLPCRAEYYKFPFFYDLKMTLKSSILDFTILILN